MTDNNPQAAESVDQKAVTPDPPLADSPQAVEGVGQKAATPDPPLADSPKDDQDADSLLDVFKSVEVEESIVSVLSRELSDVSIDSLLEQTRQVANDIKWGR